MYVVCVLVVKFCECLWWRWGSVCVCVHMCVYTLCILVIWFCESATAGECVCVHILCAYIVWLVIKFCEWFWWSRDSVCVCMCAWMCVYIVCTGDLILWICPCKSEGRVCVCVYMLWTVYLCVYVVCDCEYLLLVWQVHVYTGGGLLFLKMSFNKAACLICVDVFFSSVLIHKGSRMHLYFSFHVFKVVETWVQTLLGKWFETVWLSTHHTHSFCEQML